MRRGERAELSLKLRPGNGDGGPLWASVDNKLDRLPEAVAALKEAIRQSPLQADPHLPLPLSWPANQPAEAKEERRKAADLMREHMDLQRAEVSTHSANALLAAGKTDEAIADYKEALSFDPNYVDAHRWVGESIGASGQDHGSCRRAREGGIPSPAHPQ